MARTMVWSVGASVLALTAGSAHGEEAAATSEGPSVSQVVVTAAPYGVSEQSLTSSVNIITREQLDVAPPVGLGDLLSGQPGIRSTAFGAGASRPVIRGLSGPRVLILQNGVGQIDASDVSPDHAVASDPAEAHRIEVLRGPSTLAYGGSGIGGVVNVIDERIATSVPDRGVEGHVSGSYDANGDAANIAGHLTAGRGPWALSLQGVKKHADDYKAGGPTLAAAYERANDVTGEPGKVVRNSDVDLEEYGGGLSYIGDWGFVGASVRRTESVYGAPYPQIVGEPPGGEEGPVGIDLRQTRYDVRGEVHGGFGPFDQVKFTGGYARYRHFEFNRENGEVGTTFVSRGEEGRLELVQRKRGDWQGAVGFQGLNRDFDAVGDEAFVPPTKTGQYAVFTLQRLDHERWGVEGGLRLERTRVRADQAGRETSEPAAAAGFDHATDPSRRSFTGVSGSAAVFVRPSEAWFLSLNLAHNERAPTQYELFADGPHGGTNAFEIGDPGLGKEKVNSIEATVRYNRGPLSLEGHAYHARYDGFIQETPTGEVEDGLPVQLFQALDARFYGVEATAGWDAWTDGDRSLRFEGAYDWVRGTSSDGPTPRIPPWSVTGRAIYQTERFTARAEVRHVAEQDRISVFETPTASYTLVNLFASYKPIEGEDLRLFVEGRNLGDAVAREHASFLKDIAPLPGRSLRAGFAYEF